MAIAARYQGYRYPIEVIGHAVWLYHRFALSLRDVEELMLARGVVVSYETIRSWCAKFGPDYAAQLRRRRPRPGDKWHFDEVFVTINGTTHYLWRAVDQHGNVLDILVQSRRNAVAAKRFFGKLRPERGRGLMRESLLMRCCAGDEGLSALRSRPAGEASNHHMLRDGDVTVVSDGG